MGGNVLFQSWVAGETLCVLLLFLVIPQPIFLGPRTFRNFISCHPGLF